MLAKNWQLCIVLAASGQLHINCTRVAASHMQIVPAWPPVACNKNKIDGNLPATGGHTGTICMRLAATQEQFACDLQPLMYNLYATMAATRSQN